MCHCRICFHVPEGVKFDSASSMRSTRLVKSKDPRAIINVVSVDNEKTQPVRFQKIDRPSGVCSRPSKNDDELCLTFFTVITALVIGVSCAYFPLGPPWSRILEARGWRQNAVPILT